VVGGHYREQAACQKQGGGGGPFPLHEDVSSERVRPMDAGRWKPFYRKAATYGWGHLEATGRDIHFG
jgi:hypothetical protein